MAAYVKLTNFAVKDGLLSGNPLKVVTGGELDDEFNAIASSSQLNYDSLNNAIDAFFVKWTFSTTTTMADPGSGQVRFNNASPASVTAIAIDDLNQDGADVSTYVVSWDDSTSSGDGTLILRQGNVFAIYTVTGLTDNSGWTELAVTYVTGSGTFVSGTTTYVSFTRTGDAGTAATISVGNVTTGAPGSSASVTNTGNSTTAVFDFSIPRGDVGATGTAATIAVGTVTTGAAGSSATVTNSGTSGAAVFDFSIPRGDPGTGDMNGPASATANSLARFDGTTGKLLKDGAVIGTDVQAYDADTAKTDVAQSWTAEQTFKELKDTVHTITDGAAFEIDPANGSIQVVTLGASRTPAATNFEAGQTVLLGVDDGSAYTLTWTTVNPTWVKAGGTASAPTLATSGYTWILFWKVGSTIYGTEVGKP